MGLPACPSGRSVHAVGRSACPLGRTDPLAGRDGAVVGSAGAGRGPLGAEGTFPKAMRGGTDHFAQLTIALGCFQAVVSPAAMTTRSERERRRLLEEQLQAALEMVRSGYGMAVRALEALRAESAEEEPEGAAPLPSVGGNSNAKADPEASRPSTPAPPLPSRIPTNKWPDDVEAALPRLPEVFSKADLVHALGYQPTRGTLLRIFEKLKKEGRIEILRSSDGGKPTTYRKILTPSRI
jgi:hypothetical protein